jgi:hypothetical protein
MEFPIHFCLVYYSLFSRFIVGSLICMGKHGNKYQVNLHSQKLQKSLSRLVCFFREQKWTYAHIWGDREGLFELAV